jgi:hypothetical protein
MSEESDNTPVELERPYLVEGATMDRYRAGTERYQRQLAVLQNSPIEVLEINAKDLAYLDGTLTARIPARNEQGEVELNATAELRYFEVQDPAALAQYFAPKRCDMHEVQKRVTQDTFEKVFNDCLTSKPRDIKVYSTDTEGAFAFVSNYHVLMPNVDIFTSAEEVINNITEGDWGVETSNLDHRSARVGFVLGGEFAVNVATTHGQDLGHLGLVISNSETAQGSVRAELAFYRLICSNGLVIKSADIGEIDRIVHLGAERRRAELFDRFSESLNDMLRSAAPFIEQVEQASHGALPDYTDLNDLVKPIALTYQIPKKRAARIVDHLEHNAPELGYTYYALSQAIAEEATHWTETLSPESRNALTTAAYNALVVPLLQ